MAEAPKKDENVGSDEEPVVGLDTMEYLKNLMRNMEISQGSGEKPPPPEQLLDTVDFDGVANYMNSERCKRVITMAGAGISTSAGIPDFRSPGSGLYANLQKYNLSSPTDMFDISFFKKTPEPFFELAKELWPGTFNPTPCHFFLKLLENKGLLLRHYTQNIDTLERVAGITDDYLIEAHGTFHSSHCLQCGRSYTQDWIKEKVFADLVPRCTEEECNGLVKPDIVFFGENLPDTFAQAVATDFGQCDLLIVLGTSLVVQPFASLLDRVPDTTPRLYINNEKCANYGGGGGGGGGLFSLMGLGGGGFNFDGDDNYRDVFWQGSCDDGCTLLAEKLSWKGDLDALCAVTSTKQDTPAKKSETPLKTDEKLKSEL